MTTLIIDRIDPRGITVATAVKTTHHESAPDLSHDELRAAIRRRGWSIAATGNVQMALKNGTVMHVSCANRRSFRLALQHVIAEHRRLQSKYGD